MKNPIKIEFFEVFLQPQRRDHWIVMLRWFCVTMSAANTQKLRGITIPVHCLVKYHCKTTS